jgi:hypothetical protein
MDRPLALVLALLLALAAAVPARWTASAPPPPPDDYRRPRRRPRRRLDTVTWSTARAGTGLVRFGPAGGALDRAKRGADGAKRHKVVLSGLTPGTSYAYRVETRTADGKVASPVKRFATTSCTPRPAEVTVGAEVAIRCARFAPGERVELRWPGQAEPVGSFVASDAGGGSVRFAVPAASEGTYPVKAIGATSRRTARAAVTLPPPPYTFDAALVWNRGWAPSGVAVDWGSCSLCGDGLGLISVASLGDHQIHKFTTGAGLGAHIGSLGGQDRGDGQFIEPSGVAVDGAGNVYVADTNNNRIEKFASDGTFLAKWGSRGGGDGQLDLPSGIAVDRAGTVFLTEPGNDLIKMFKPTSS